jgi:alkylated DNA repair dioxygenase AlkB
VTLAWQDSLFDGEPEGDGAGASGVPLSFERLHRLDLDERSWVDICETWLPDHAETFDLLLRDAPWQQRERWMYERTVLEPRLVAAWSGGDLAALPSRLQQVRAAVSDRYHVEFDSVLVNLYRDGRDGVAWHGDTVRRTLEESVVVTVALGERRRFLMRPGDHGPAAVRLLSGHGDLVVMGGRCQNEWQHTVPKETRAGARMSITMRHSRPLPA